MSNHTSIKPASFVQTLLKKSATILLSLSEISLPIDLSGLYLYFTLCALNWIAKHCMSGNLLASQSLKNKDTKLMLQIKEKLMVLFGMV